MVISAALPAVGLLVLMEKHRSLFGTIDYLDRQGAKQAVSFEISKTALVPLLTSLEKRTGKLTQYEDGIAAKVNKP